ncbi:MAG: YezD family protein [Verrucomicrobiota bacterium]
MGDKFDRTELAGGDNQDWLNLVREQVSSLRFGVVEIVVHESRVVQIEKTERLRLDKKDGDNRRTG